MVKRLPAAVLGFLFFALGLVSNSSMAQTKGCYLLKVHIWPIEELPQEMQEAIRTQMYPNLSNKYGGLLRSLADTNSSTSSSFSCTDIRDKKADDTVGINTGTVKRSQKTYTVEVEPRFKAAIQAETVNGIAKLYFTDTNRLQIKVVDPEKKVVFPKLGFMSFDASEWQKDSTGNSTNGYIMSVHFFVKNNP